MTEFQPNQTVAILANSLQGEMFKVKIRKVIFESAIVAGYRPMEVPLPLSALCTVAEAKRNIAAYKKAQKRSEVRQLKFTEEVKKLVAKFPEIFDGKRLEIFREEFDGEFIIHFGISSIPADVLDSQTE